MSLLSYSNSKLIKSSTGPYLIAVWNLPAGDTCPGAGACKAICYAQKGNYARFKLNEKVYSKNLELSKTPEFAELMQLSIEAGKRKASKLGKQLAIRIHSAGDFYAPRYFQIWAALAKANPDVVFYAYTKSAFVWRARNVPNNLRVIQSEGSLYDGLIDENRPHARIFDSRDDLLAAGYCDASQDDSVAITSTKIGLIKH